MRHFIVILALGAVLLGPGNLSASPPASSPNIILILADDLGYGDVGVYGAELIETPNLDRLAGEGIRLTNFYASGNVCSPSRAGLLTGRYAIRDGLADRTITAGDTRGLPAGRTTIAGPAATRGLSNSLDR